MTAAEWLKAKSDLKSGKADDVLKRIDPKVMKIDIEDGDVVTADNGGVGVSIDEGIKIEVKKGR